MRTELLADVNIVEPMSPSAIRQCWPPVVKKQINLKTTLYSVKEL